MSAVRAATCSGVSMLRLKRMAEETPRLIRSRSSCGGFVPVKPTASIFAAIRSREDMGLESSGRGRCRQIGAAPARDQREMQPQRSQRRSAETLSVQDGVRVATLQENCRRSLHHSIGAAYALVSALLSAYSAVSSAPCLAEQI